MNRILDWLIPPTTYSFMVLFATLTLYEVFMKAFDVVSPLLVTK